MAITNYNDLTPKRTSTIMMTTDSSANESPEKKRYSSSEDVDEDREKRLAAVRVTIFNIQVLLECNFEQ